MVSQRERLWKAENPTRMYEKTLLLTSKMVQKYPLSIKAL